MTSDQQQAEPKWAAIVDDRLVPMPRRQLKARDILHQSGAKPGLSLIRDYSSPNDIAFDPDAEVDLAEGNVFRTAAGCQYSHQIPCDAPAKLSFIVDDRFEITIQPKQTGESLRGLLNLPSHVDLLRDHESPRDEAIEDEERINFADGPVFITRNADTRDVTIIVNGRPKTVTGKTISFEQVVALAYNPVRTEPFVLYTVSYSRGPRANPEGELLAGQHVKVKDRMVFLVTETDKS